MSDFMYMGADHSNLIYLVRESKGKNGCHGRRQEEHTPCPSVGRETVAQLLIGFNNKILKSGTGGMLRDKRDGGASHSHTLPR